MFFQKIILSYKTIKAAIYKGYKGNNQRNFNTFKPFTTLWPS